MEVARADVSGIPLKYFALATSVCKPHGVDVTFEGVIGTVSSEDKRSFDGEEDTPRHGKRTRKDVVQ